MLCRYGPCEPEALKERMKRAVALLGPAEVQDILAKQGKIEVRAAPSNRTPVHLLLAAPPAKGPFSIILYSCSLSADAPCLDWQEKRVIILIRIV